MDRSTLHLVAAYAVFALLVGGYLLWMARAEAALVRRKRELEASDEPTVRHDQ